MIIVFVYAMLIFNFVIATILPLSLAPLSVALGLVSGSVCSKLVDIYFRSRISEVEND